jgi:hypothetical protein
MIYVEVELEACLADDEHSLGSKWVRLRVEGILGAFWDG